MSKPNFSNAFHNMYLIKYAQFESKGVEITLPLLSSQTQGTENGIDQRKLHQRTTCYLDTSSYRNQHIIRFQKHIA